MFMDQVNALVNALGFGTMTAIGAIVFVIATGVFILE